MLPVRLFHSVSSSSSPSAVPLCPATTSLSWVRSPWCQAGLEGRIGSGGGGGGKGLYSAGWCCLSLFSPPRRPSWDAAMKNTQVVLWCSAVVWWLAKAGPPLSPAVGSGHQFLQTALASHLQGQILCSWAVQCQCRFLNKTVWSGSSAHTEVQGLECVDQEGHSLLLYPRREEVNSIKS